MRSIDTVLLVSIPTFRTVILLQSETAHHLPQVQFLQTAFSLASFTGLPLLRFHGTSFLAERAVTKRTPIASSQSQKMRVERLETEVC
jgi:hypothetical protein